MRQKIDILAFAAHPDDVEIAAAGTLLKQKSLGKKIGIIDLTQGELGTRGNKETREKESQKSSEILGLDVRENLKLKDGFFEINEETLLKVIQVIRKYKPETILINSPKDRHPDHGKAHELVKRAAFLSGLIKIETFDNKNHQEVWRPKNILAYIQDYFIEPNVVIEVSDYWEKRMAALMAFDSQFFNLNSNEPNTPISSPEFLKHIEGRAIQMGRYINGRLAEGFVCVNPLKIETF